MNSDNDNLKDQLTKAQQRHGQRNITATSIFSIIYFYSVNATVLNLFAVKIGMPPDKVGLMNSFVSLFAIVQLFLANALERDGKRRYVLSFYGLQALCAFAFPLIPLIYHYLGSVQAINALLLVTAAAAMFGNLGQAGWFPLIRDSVPDAITGRFFARMRTAWQIAGTLYLILTGIYLGSEPSMARFSVVFAIGFIAAIVRQFFILRIPERKVNPEAEETSLAQALVMPLRDRNYRRYLLFSMALFFAVGFVTPFIVVYMKSCLKLPSGMVAVISAMEAAGAVVTLILWGKISDRYGQRSVFGLSAFLLGLTTLAWAVIYGEGVALIFSAALVSLLRGAAIAGINLGQISYSMRVAPHIKGASYVIAAFIASGTALGLGPIIGGKAILFMDNNASVLYSGSSSYSILFLTDVLLIIAAMVLKKRINWEGDLASIGMAGRMGKTAVGKLTEISFFGRQDKETPE
ncbi:MAG: MFS transporter [bacterium]|nr:MFS transporter [bacterium]MDD4152117.1 MFS transporter [bacterium]MDD4557578.1 MFS transporter [bacterium]